ncbi:MAG TPA: DUF2330 domain-containing protein [Kofleriaceae bacterium]|nr:DUF2330 domain-containing protein [Kofleriaceae bacterium]
MMKRALIVAAFAAFVPRVADAFCGFYVAGSNEKLYNDATQVVLMREGTRTVLAMQNAYKGPPEAFAMVVPVPVVLQEKDVKTLPKEVFGKVDTMGAPRLVEYWEQDPCAPEVDYDMAVARAGGAPTSAAEGTGKGGDLGVKIEAKFTVGEYQILILSAKDSTGLDTWLRREKYTIPAGAEPLLRPYVESGMKFFVAKVDPAKVKWVGTGNDKRAELSPLRFHYDADEFALPIRLGLANSNGTQDLIVNILAPHQRYEVTNYKNVRIPTNLDVRPAMKEQFAEFYAALFDRTVAQNPGAVVTEYAWDAGSCDPCPGPNLDYQDFATLGADVLSGTRDKPAAYQNGDFVLTRLHARYGKDITNDLVFKAAQPIAGGREHLANNGKLEEGSVASPINNFQGRYAIRYPWTGPIACKDPKRGRWGGPPNGGNQQQPTAAKNLAYAKRDAVKLPEAVTRDVPEIGIKAAAASSIATPGTTTEPGSGSAAPSPGSDTKPAPTTPQKSKGCGCSGSSVSDSGGLLLVLGALLVQKRRRRSRIQTVR